MCALPARSSAGYRPFGVYVSLEVINMSEAISLSAHFSGPSGALIMSFISLSIVFLVIIGLMLMMVVIHKLVSASISVKSSKNSSGESN